MLTQEEWMGALNARHGKERQEKFSRAVVAVCGLGGLGSNVAIALARAGIGKLILIDFDRVDVTNLNRQQYKASQLGMNKTEALAQICGRSIRLSGWRRMPSAFRRRTHRSFCRKRMLSAKHLMFRKRRRCSSILCWRTCRRNILSQDPEWQVLEVPIRFRHAGSPAGFICAGIRSVM